MSDRVSFRLDDGLLDQAQVLAEQRGKTLSDVVREALDAYCDHQAEGLPSPHTPDQCTRALLSSLPAELVAEIETKATRSGLTLREVMVATLTTTWGEGLQQARAKRPPTDVMHWPPRVDAA